MMNLTHYVWIYGLAEALLVSLVVSIVFGVKWWRLHQRQRHLAQSCEEVNGLIAGEIVAAGRDLSSRPETRERKLSFLKVLSRPFRDCWLNDLVAWRDVLERVNRCFDEVETGERRGSSRDNTATQRSLQDLEPETEIGFQKDSLPSLDLDSDLDSLLAQYRLGMSALSANQEAKSDLKHQYQDLQRFNRDLRMKLESIAELDATGELRKELGEFERGNVELMQTAFATERSFNILVQQFGPLEERIHDLQSTVKNYRKSVHKVLVQRDYLAEENKQLGAQLKAANKLVGRLNRNYAALRREYTTLYNSLSP